MLTIEKRLPYDHALDWTQFCWCQGTIYRNTQLIQTHIMYCTPWEEYKQTQRPHRSWRERTTALMWYYSPTKNKLIYQVRANTYDYWLSWLIAIYSYSTSWTLFPQKMMRCPCILCFIYGGLSTKNFRIFRSIRIKHFNTSHIIDQIKVWRDWSKKKLQRRNYSWPPDVSAHDTLGDT